MCFHKAGIVSYWQQFAETFVNEIPSSPWVTWPKGVKHTLRSFGCILHECERFREDPFLSNELLQVYLNVKLAPKDVSDVNGKPINKDRMRKIRLKSLDDHVFPCILANYTKAHHLPIELLMKNGLFGGLFMQEGRPRFLTSPEIFVLMGGTSASFLPACKDARIHTLGNCISVPHAAIILLNFLAICHEKDIRRLIYNRCLLPLWHLGSRMTTWEWESWKREFSSITLRLINRPSVPQFLWWHLCKLSCSRQLRLLSFGWTLVCIFYLRCDYWSVNPCHQKLRLSSMNIFTCWLKKVTRLKHVDNYWKSVYHVSCMYMMISSHSRIRQWLLFWHHLDQLSSKKILAWPCWMFKGKSENFSLKFPRFLEMRSLLSTQ